MSKVSKSALELFDAGIVTIPIALDGSKRPIGMWGEWIEKPPTRAQVDLMFKKACGLAVLCGPTSGGLECIDFDQPGYFADFADLLNEVAPGLIDKLVRIETPRGDGFHLYYRTGVTQGNQKLALLMVDGKKQTAIETRGKGGYAIIPPSPPEAHPSKRPYKHVGGPTLVNVQAITDAERKILIECAMSLNLVAEEATTPAQKKNEAPPVDGELTPGQDFELRGDWHDILKPHGWTVIRERGDVIHWQRPGKDGKGISATTGHCGTQLYVFSSNAAPFNSGRVYNKFAVYAFLNHASDFAGAARQLRKDGYGSPRSRKRTAEVKAVAERLDQAFAPREASPPLEDDTPMPSDDDAPYTAKREREIAAASERLTARKLEEMMDDEPTAAFQPGTFERVAAMREDRAEWVAICELMRRRKQKQALNNALKEHDRKERMGVAHDAKWKSQLLYRETKDGPSLDRCLANLVVILEHDESWRSCVRLDKFSNRIAISPRSPLMRDPDQRWSDTDVLKTKMWIEREYGIRPSTDDIHGAIVIVADTNSFNPLRDYLDALPAPSGDQEDLLDTFLIDFFGAPDTPLTRALGAKWMIAAIARAYKPGCKVDTVLILEGIQGLKKSRFLAQLCPETTWFADGLSEFGSKDQAVEIEGKWIIELAEMKGFGKELDAIKAFISRAAENYRPPYGRNDIHSPRKCVFAATVNPEVAGYLRDSTGNRRFWPIACTKQSPELEPAVRDRLWSEAKARFEAGERWWLEDAELIAAAEKEQENRVVLDAWHDRVEDYVSSKASTSIDEILENCLRIDIGKRDHGHVTRVGRILTMLKWQKYRPRRDGRQKERRYRNPSALFDEDVAAA
jgi:predicted P-loop ATPase